MISENYCERKADAVEHKGRSLNNASLVGTEDLLAVRSFLEEHIQSTLFLLGNLELYGQKLGEPLNSANYYMIKRAGVVAAVFALTRRGNLLLQSNHQADDSAEIYETVSGERISLRGIIGNWQDSSNFLRYYQTQNPNFRVSLKSVEISYSLELSRPMVAGSRDGCVRFLEKSDFDQWNRLSLEFMKESGIPIQGSVEDRQRSFEAYADRGYWWGYFLNQELVSIAGLNARYQDVGQVGGVYTVKDHRRKGYSKACMISLIEDSRVRHRIRTLILFTGEENAAARAMYEGLGFQRKGDFALIFGEEDEHANKLSPM